jgi:hypothetical protein
MLRKSACASAIVVWGLSFALADEFPATITKVDNGKITFKKGKTKDLGEEMTLPVMADAKVTKGKVNADTKKVEAGDPIPNGLKNEQFTKMGEKGLRVTLTTDADNKHITAIKVGGGVKDKTAGKAKEITITKVDVKKGTVTAKMQIKGKDVEKTFKLAEDIEYMDSTGKVATVDIFTSGEMVLIVERDGMITRMAKKDASDTKKKSNSK